MFDCRLGFWVEIAVAQDVYADQQAIHTVGLAFVALALSDDISDSAWVSGRLCLLIRRFGQGSFLGMIKLLVG